MFGTTGNINLNVVGNLRRSFESKHKRKPKLTDEQVWKAFEDGYFCEDAEEAYIEFMEEAEASSK